MKRLTAPAAQRTSTPEKQLNAHRESALVQSLTWRRSTKGWRLYAGSRCFGEVIQDSTYPGMCRARLSGWFSVMANLSWARNAVLEAAVREIEYEERQQAAKTPSISQQLGGVFQTKSSQSDLSAEPRPDSHPPSGERYR